MGRVVVKVEVATAGTIPMELGHLARDTFISSVVGHLANELGIVERSSSSYNENHAVYVSGYIRLVPGPKGPSIYDVTLQGGGSSEV